MRYCPETLKKVTTIGTTIVTLGAIAAAGKLSTSEDGENKSIQATEYSESALSADEKRLGRLLIRQAAEARCLVENTGNIETCRPGEAASRPEIRVAPLPKKPLAVQPQEAPERRAPEPKPKRKKYPVDCERYRPLMEKYPWPVEDAMLVMREESSCDPYAVSDTDDHGLMQLHGHPIYEPAKNIAVAYRIYKEGRVGRNNWSAWYAVCTRGNNPQPKFPGIDCQ